MIWTIMGTVLVVLATFMVVVEPATPWARSAWFSFAVLILAVAGAFCILKAVEGMVTW